MKKNGNAHVIHKTAHCIEQVLLIDNKMLSRLLLVP